MQIEREFEEPGRVLITFSAEEFDIFVAATKERIKKRAAEQFEVFKSDQNVVEEAERTDLGRLRWLADSSEAGRWLLGRLEEFVENTPPVLSELSGRYLTYKAYRERHQANEGAKQLVKDIKSELAILSLTEDLARIDSPGNIQTYGP